MTEYPAKYSHSDLWHSQEEKFRLFYGLTDEETWRMFLVAEELLTNAKGAPDFPNASYGNLKV